MCTSPSTISSPTRPRRRRQQRLYFCVAVVYGKFAPKVKANPVCSRRGASASSVRRSLSLHREELSQARTSTVHSGSESLQHLPGWLNESSRDESRQWVRNFWAKIYRLCWSLQRRSLLFSRSCAVACSRSSLGKVVTQYSTAQWSGGKQV